VREATEARFRFAPRLALAVRGAPWLVREFASEYRGAESADAGADVEVSFETPIGPDAVRGGHKTVRWEVSLSAAGETPLRAAIALRGRPRSFSRSLVQGYYVEPLLSVAAARQGQVLLPAAAFETDAGALVVMGRSRSGKSTLAFRVAAAGARVLGDDQVLLDGRDCLPFPRRARLYPDSRQTAPAAYAGLAPRDRVALRARGVLRRLTAGYVAPSLAVETGGRPCGEELPIARIVLIERGPGDELGDGPLTADAATDAALDLLRDQRAHLAAAGPAWAEAAAAAERQERERLTAVFASLPLERLRLPDAWGAPRSVEALAARLGLEEFGPDSGPESFSRGG
jgi:hypothetical protein